MENLQLYDKSFLKPYSLMISTFGIHAVASNERENHYDTRDKEYRLIVRY